MNQLITVIGPIASGKSTASRQIADNFNIPLVDADLFETNPFLPLYVQDIARWSFANELFFTIQRIKKLRQLKRLVKKHSVVVDAGLIMSHHAYTKNHLVQGTMTAAEYEFFSQIVADYQEDIPQPTIIISLEASPETQKHRIETRGRAFEADYTLEYLQQITDRINEYTVTLKNDPKITFIPFSTERYDLSVNDNRQKLFEVLQPHLHSGRRLDTQKV